MTSVDLINHLVETSNWTKYRLAKSMGFTPQAFDHRMRAASLKVDFLATTLNKLGYELIAIPQGSRLPNGSIKIEDELSLESRKRNE